MDGPVAEDTAGSPGGTVTVDRRGKTAWLSNGSSRPLFVAEAEFKPSRLLASKVKRALLVLQGTGLLVVHAADAGNSTADRSSAPAVPAAVLRHIGYTELLEVSVAAASSIKIRHSCSTSKARISSSLRSVSTLTAGNLESGSSTYAAGVSHSEAGSTASDGSNDTNTRGFPAAAATTAAPPLAGASVKVSYESFTLSFKDAPAAHRAAAALLFQRAQHAAAQQWLSQGFHAGFRCEAVSCTAAPLQETAPRTPGASRNNSSSKATSGGGSSSSGSCCVTSWGGSAPLDVRSIKAGSAVANSAAGACRDKVSAGAAAAVPASAAGCMPWASVSPGWACTVPLPASWSPILHAATSDAAAAAAANSIPARPAAQIEPEVTLEDLSCAVELAEGPAALQLSITTPYGLAQATITPQHVRAALLSSECREVLAVPAAESSAGVSAAGDSQTHNKGRRPVGFSYTVAGQLPLGPQMQAGGNKLGNSSSSGSLASLRSLGSSRRTSFSVEAAAAGQAPSAAAAAGLGTSGAAGASGDSQRSQLPVHHTVEVYAAVKVAVVRDQTTSAVPLQRAASGRGQPPDSQVAEPRTPTSTFAEKAAIAAAAAAAQAAPALAEPAGLRPTVGSGCSSSGVGGYASGGSMAGGTAHAGCVIPHHLQLVLCALMGATVAAAARCSWTVAVLVMAAAAVAAGATLSMHSSSSSSSSSSSPHCQIRDDHAEGRYGSATHKAEPDWMAGEASAPAAAAAATAETKHQLSAVTVDDCNTTHSSRGGSGGGMAGWSLQLLGADLVATPSRYLQMQMEIARTDQQLLQLRQQDTTQDCSSDGCEDLAAAGPAAAGPAAAAAAVSLGEVVEHLLEPHGSPAAAAAATKQLPVFISDPEPAWLTHDNKQRFLHDAFTARGAKQHARNTHEWRQKYGVDGAFERPVPYHTAVTTAFPTYLLMDESSDGLAVLFTRVGCIKELCNLMFHPPEGAAGVPFDELEYTMAVLNEYLTKVAAPRPLPGGSQVQIYDLAGFKLSMVNSDLLTLCKMLGRFVQYYPARVHSAFVINAPGWFATPWKLMSSFLDAKTKSRVMVVSDAKEILPVLAQHMGGMHNVPEQWGGNDPTPFNEYPAHQRMLAFAKKLNEGEKTE